MKFVITAVTATFIGLTPCQAQSHFKVNALSIELGKTGLLFNLTFDHKAKKKNMGFRLGAGSNFSRYLNASAVGGGAYYLVGKANRFFEVGADLQYLLVDEVSDDQRGLAFVYPDYSIKTFYPSLNLGYRAYGKHTLFRIGVSPGVIDGDFVPGGYVGLGWRF